MTSALPLRIARVFRRLTSDPSYPLIRCLRFFKPKGIFQPFNDTASDRYPRIFQFVQSELGAQSDLRILSFGCSTGEEVVSLRRYFPRASVKGVDCNPGNILVCRKRLRQQPDAAISFAVAASAEAEPAGAYDAVFCMAVLRDGRLGRPGVTRCDPYLRFSDFASMVESFRRCLKPGALLVIRHSNFRLSDAPAGAGFETLLRVAIPRDAKTPIFGSDNRLMADVVYGDTVFRRIA